MFVHLVLFCAYQGSGRGCGEARGAECVGDTDVDGEGVEADVDKEVSAGAGEG